MAFTYVLATVIGQIRLLIPDATAAAYFYEDDEITALYTLESNNVKRAAALGLEGMASDEAYIQKRSRLLDLTTDGPAVADALLKRAALLRAQADDDEAATLGEFDWAELVYDDFSYRERVDKEAQRDS
jgi:hypothetical protein